MENRNDILNELKELSPVVAAIEKVNVFTVPNGYFEHLSTDIMMGIGYENGMKYNTASGSPIADVPPGYFDSLADHILQNIKAQDTDDAATEIRTLSPMLYSIQNENVFEVPAGYFESLHEEVLNKVMPKQPKVIVMQKRSSTFFKYAIAAAFTGVMVLGVFKFTGNKPAVNLPDYVTAGLQVGDIDQELEKIADADIVKFLEAGGTDFNAALVANSVDKNELPSQEDYLTDEKALDKYLDDIQVNDSKN